MTDAMWAYDAIVKAYPAVAVTSTPRAALSALLTEFTRQREEIEQVRRVLAAALDRDKDPKDTVTALANLASNGIYWRDKQIAALSSQLDRLREEIETEKAAFRAFIENAEPRYTTEVTSLRSQLERLTEVRNDLLGVIEGQNSTIDRYSRDIARLKADSKRMDWLESLGVQSVYLNEHPHQFNPASQSFRAAIDNAMDGRPE